MSKPQSILMFCPQFRPLVGGAERQAEKLSAALVRRGLRVTVLTPRFDKESPDYEESCGVATQRFPLFDLCKQLPSLRGFGPLNLALLRHQTMKATANFLGDADILHAHIASPLSAFAIQAAHRVGVPTICKVATSGAKTDLGEISRLGIAGMLISGALVNCLDRWIATTDAVKQSLADAGVAPAKIVKIPNGVEIPGTLRSSKRLLAKRFLYLGRLSTNIQRDVPTLIRAFDHVADQVPDAELALVGHGDLFSETENLVLQCRNRGRIKMTGLQEPEPWLEWADCLILPSRYEGLSNALLEGMSHELACIANDIPANREVLDGGAAGILVSPGNETQLADEMLRLAVIRGISTEFGASAFDRVSYHYSIEAVADKYVQLYQALTH